MVVEDVHRADDATLDVVRYLAWRIPALPSVLLLTWSTRAARRPSAAPGPRAYPDVRRLVLRPLSSGAVEELADGHGADAGAVLVATAGNPFFVTEVLANPGVEVPATVRDAVLARLGGLSEPTQRALELLSTVPGQAERCWWRRCSAATRRRWTRPSGAACCRPTPGTSGSATSWPAGRSSGSAPPRPGRRQPAGPGRARPPPGGRAVAADPPRPPGRRPRGGRPPPGCRPRGGRRRRLQRGPGPLRAGAALVGPAAGHPAGDRAGGERLGALQPLPL